MVPERATFLVRLEMILLKFSALVIAIIIVLWVTLAVLGDDIDRRG